MPEKTKEVIPLDRKWLYALKGGDKVVRMIGGTIPLLLTVTFVTERVVAAGPWQFSRMYGLEIDGVIGSDGTPQTPVLSYIRKPTKMEEAEIHARNLKPTSGEPSTTKDPF